MITKMENFTIKMEEYAHKIVLIGKVSYCVFRGVVEEFRNAS